MKNWKVVQEPGKTLLGKVPNLSVLKNPIKNISNDKR